MADYMTTYEKWVCPDCGAVQYEIVPVDCPCQDDEGDDDDETDHGEK